MQKYVAPASDRRALAKSVAAGSGAYDASGVDLTLLRWMIGLSPRERLVVMEQHARDTERLLEYGRRHREAKARSNGSAPRAARRRGRRHRRPSRCVARG